MAEKERVPGMLSPYRVLDLTDEKGLFCGKLLGDLGADVIKIERPGGDPARNIGPFYHDEVHPEKSLFWFAFNTNKRGITLDIETTEGQETFKKLVKTADLVIESFPPGYLGKLGLGYSALEKINPGIILVSITPFGQTGPYKDYKTSDIVAWATGGVLYQYGDPDRPPIRISHHSQAYLHGAGHAAVGAMIALLHREMTGEGQHVDVSIEESVARCSERLIANWEMRVPATWEVRRAVQRRGMGLTPSQNVRTTRMWPCKDGHIIWLMFAGEGATKRNQPLLQWMTSQGRANDFLQGCNWDVLDMTSTAPEVQKTVDRLSEQIGKFFLRYTKAELLEGAVKYGVMLYPISNVADILESVQLTARKYWVELEHPELGITITYPGAFAQLSATPPRVWHRAPLIGEHNQEVLKKELGLSKKELLKLRQVQHYPLRPSQKGKKLEGKPFEGIRVLDFGWAWAGPLTTKILADYGAEVIKIESRTRPDVHRVTYPFRDAVPGVNRSGQWNYDNTGKLSLTLNLTKPKGVEIVRRLAAQSDIAVDNFAGGTMEKMGIGYAELKKVKPNIIMLGTCMQGHTGPYAEHPGFGMQLTALAGFNHITGWPDRGPVWLSAYTDFPPPLFNGLTILAALDYRRRTGQGQYIDMSQFENTIHFMAPLILDYMVNQRVASRMGNRYPYAAPHEAYRCRDDDRWCAIAVFTDEEWRSFCQVITNPAWTKDARFATLSARKENEDELNRLVEEWTINHSPEEVMSLMQTARVAAGVVQNAEDLLEHDPQVKHRHFFQEVDHPEVGKYHAPSPPFVLSKCPCKLRPAPLLGEHNEYVLKGLLGMSDEEVAELVITGVIE